MENSNNISFTFDSPKGQSSIIKVMGVGGGGGNAVNHMYKEGIEGVDFIVCNTDMKALYASPVPNKILLGQGLGAGGKAECAKAAALEKADEIREALSHNTKMLFITAGMGGGTGTGAAPVVAEIAKSIELNDGENKNILVVAIVTRPFSFEGKKRCSQAEDGIAELRKHVDAIIIINNDQLRAFGNNGISVLFGMADDVLLTAAKGIAEIITQNAYVNRDFQDVNSVMEHSGKALMGTGSGKGENRAHDAIEAATTSVLLDDSDIRGAKNVMLYFTYSSQHEMTGDEMTEITDFVYDRTNGTADIIWGAGPDENLGDELKVILIATGFEKEKPEEEPKTFELTSTDPVKPKQETAANSNPDEIIVVHRDTPAPDVSVPAAVVPDAPHPTQVVEPPVIIVPTVPIMTEQPKQQENVTSSRQETVPANPAEVATSAKVSPAFIAEKPTPNPAEKPASNPTEEKHIFYLDPEDEAELSIEEARRVAQHQVEERHNDSMVENIRMISSHKDNPSNNAGTETQRVAEAKGNNDERHEKNDSDKKNENISVPQPDPARAASSVFSSAFSNDNDVMTANERIAHIHNLLRTNPEGADIVASMHDNVQLFDGYHSSHRESSGIIVHPDGHISKNPYLYGNKPD